MLRRSHKKSRSGCMQCRQRHVKCDETRPSCRLCVNSRRECSFNHPSRALPSKLSTHPITLESPRGNDSSVASVSTLRSTLSTPAHLSLRQSSVLVPVIDGNVNLDHIERLIHLSLEKDMFNLASGIENYDPSSLILALVTRLNSPALMHQLLAFSSRHLAYEQPERSTFLCHQAVALQTKAISLFNTMYNASSLDIDRSNCVIILLFASVLGHHVLADVLSTRPAEGLDALVGHYCQCFETRRGIYTIVKTAWPIFMASELEPILSLSSAFTSREPRGHHCQLAREMVDESNQLFQKEKEACRSALRYLQIGLDAVTAESEECNRYQMICSWIMLITPDFASLLSAMRPEALVIFAHYAEMLHYGRKL
ncbi:hypothetical protein M3J09_010354 [Ascochyta lentis]